MSERYSQWHWWYGKLWAIVYAYTFIHSQWRPSLAYKRTHTYIYVTCSLTLTRCTTRNERWNDPHYRWKSSRSSQMLLWLFCCRRRHCECMPCVGYRNVCSIASHTMDLSHSTVNHSCNWNELFIKNPSAIHIYLRLTVEHTIPNRGRWQCNMCLDTYSATGPVQCE